MANISSKSIKIIDARGRSCPEPVIMTKTALENNKGQTIQVLVDAMVAVENIKRYAQNQGCKVEVQEKAGEYSIIVGK